MTHEPEEARQLPSPLRAGSVIPDYPVRTAQVLPMRTPLQIAFVVALSAASSAQDHFKISTNADQVLANASSYECSTSSDGRYVAFASEATNLVPVDFSARNIFVRDRALGVTEIVSKLPGGSTGASDSFAPAISADGRYVAFSSLSPNLIVGDANQAEDVFRFDRWTNQIQLVSLSSSGVQGNNHSRRPSISGDGRFIAFQSQASNLSANSFNSFTQVFLRDMELGLTIHASMSPGGLPANGNCLLPSISADGTTIAFESVATNLVPGVTVSRSHIYIHDVASASTISATADSNSVVGNGDSHNPRLTCDGTAVVFDSVASNFVISPSTTGGRHCYYRDLSLLTFKLVSKTYLGDAASPSFEPDINCDGSLIAFVSLNNNITNGGVNGYQAVYVHDRSSGTTEVVSRGIASVYPNGPSGSPRMSGDGTSVAFWSDTSDLVPFDAAGRDVFEFVDAPTCFGHMPYCTAKVNSQGCTPRICAWGRLSATGPDDFRLHATLVLNQRSGLLIWGTQSAAVPFYGGTLCLTGQIKRTPVQGSGGSSTGGDCTGTYNFHFTQALASANGVGAGHLIYFQYWSRDTGFPVPLNVGLTAGLAVTVDP
jgi:Tol biopolymer transport system component